MAVVNWGALWVLAPSLLAIWAGVSRLLTPALAALLVWVMLSAYYGHLAPQLRHEWVWMLIGLVATPLFAVVARAVDGRRRTLLCAAVIATEPLVVVVFQILMSRPSLATGITGVAQLTVASAVMALVRYAPERSGASTAPP